MADHPPSGGAAQQGAFNVIGALVSGKVLLLLLLILVVVSAGEQATELLKNPWVLGGLAVAFLVWVRR